MDEKLNPHLDLEIKLEIPELKEEPEDCNTEYSYAIDEGQIKQETSQDIDNGVIKVEEKKSNNIDPLPSLGRGKEITDFAVKVSTNVKTPTGIDDKHSSGVPSVSGCGLQLGLHSELDIKFEPEEDLNEDPLAFDETADHYGTSPTSDHKLQANGTSEDSRSQKTSYACETCIIRNTQNSILKTHTKIHTGVKPNSCEKCGVKLNQKSNLKVRTGEKSYGCDICNKKFTRQNNLARHARKHTGHKPYTCEICSSTFAQKSNLEAHKLIHTGDKPYSCEICGRKFNHMSNLKKHISIHTLSRDKPYTCDRCNKTFTDKRNLGRHKLIHTGEKPYVCELCDKKFSVKYTLERHKEIHIRER